MKLFVDIFPIMLFFFAYKFAGIYTATVVAILASFLQVFFMWYKTRKIDTLQIITLLLITILGSATLFFHNEIFIKWKPTAVYWAFACAFLGTQLFTQKPLIQMVLDSQLKLPKLIWTRLNSSWALFFFIMGGTNLYVAYHYTTDIWVNFKLFGIVGATFLFTLLQGAFIARYLQSHPEFSPHLNN